MMNFTIETTVTIRNKILSTSALLDRLRLLTVSPGNRGRTTSGRVAKSKPRQTLSWRGFRFVVARA
jgi:hypothetical protein